MSKRAEKDLVALPLHVRRRFEAALDRLQGGKTDEVDLVQIEGTDATWRLRIGLYRGIFEWTSEGMWFTRFAHRSKVYRGF